MHCSLCRSVAILLSANVPLAAHQLYLMPSTFHGAQGERITVGFHYGDSFPESDSPPAPERLKDAAIHAGKLQYNVTNLRIDGKRAVGDARLAAKGTLVISARMVPEFSESQPAEFEKYLREKGMGQALQWRARNGESGKAGRETQSKHVKALVRVGSSGDDTYTRPVGHTLEFLADKDPYSLKSGDRLPVRVLLRGKPASGLLVMAAHADAGGAGSERQAGRTDGEGRLLVLLDRPGKWRFTAIAIERNTNAEKSDWESFWASLTFELPI